MNTRAVRFTQTAIFAFGCISVLTAIMTARLTRVGQISIRWTLATGCFIALAYVASLLVEGAWRISGRVARRLLALAGSHSGSTTTNATGEGAL